MGKCNHCNQTLSKGCSQFCCVGCEIAYKLINKLNLGKYYDYCQSIYNKTPTTVHEVSNELNYNEYISTEEGTHSINLIVEGIHCGSCVWLIESTLMQNVAVKAARVNMSTRRLRLQWQGDKDEIAKLTKLVQQLGYKLIPFEPDALEESELQREKYLIKCMAVSGFALANLMMISVAIWAGLFDNSMGEGLRVGLHWISGFIAVPAVLFAGMPFFKSAFNALKARYTNMDVPISIASIAAVLISIQETIKSADYSYFDAAVGLIFFLLIGRYLDIKARNKARERANGLILSQARSVTLVEGEKLRLVKISLAKEGDTAFVAVGEKIPVDGVVIEGESEVDNSLITGETIPEKVAAGSAVNAGTINLSAPLKIRIVKLGDATVLGEIIRLMENAEQGKARYVKLADKAASFYTPVVLSLAFFTCVGWYFWVGISLSQSLLYAVAVLIVTCPCALGLAVPVVQIIASSRMMASGILIKSADALERIADIDTIVFDKTGTLTLGQPSFSNPRVLNADKLRLVASLASISKHPLCEAIGRSYDGDLLSLNAKEVKGMGVEAKYQGKIVKIGNRKWCGVDSEIKDNAIEMWFCFGKAKPVRLTFSDEIKSDSKELVKWVKKKGFAQMILSGDRASVVSDIAKKLGIKEYYSEFKPKDKYEFLQALDADGKKVLMIGDGLNDSAALKAAHASMSPSSAIDITQTSSDIIFQGSKMEPVIETWNVAQKSNLLIKQNFILSFAYNLVTIPIAVAGFVTPIVAAIAMSTSSIIVVLNSMRLNLKG